MKSLYSWIVLIVSIAFLVSSCRDTEVVRSDSDYGYKKKIKTDKTPPTVSSISTTSDNQSSVSISDNITVTFSESMDTTSVTTNTSNTS